MFDQPEVSTKFRPSSAHSWRRESQFVANFDFRMLKLISISETTQPKSRVRKPCLGKSSGNVSINDRKILRGQRFAKALLDYARLWRSRLTYLLIQMLLKKKKKYSDVWSTRGVGKASPKFRSLLEITNLFPIDQVDKNYTKIFSCQTSVWRILFPNLLSEDFN